MKSKLSRLKESFGETAVMSNVIDPVSRYYCEKNILRQEDEPLFKHLEVCSGITPEIAMGIIGEHRPDCLLPLSGDEMGSWLNTLCKIINQCANSSEFSIVNEPVFAVEAKTEDMDNYFKSGIDYLLEENKTMIPMYEAVNTDELADKVLSDIEVLLLMQLAQPNKHRTYNKSQREILKKELKDKNSSAYRVLSTNYLKEADEVSQIEAIEELGLKQVAEAQKKTISLVESNGNILVCAVGRKGYNIIKLKV